MIRDDLYLATGVANGLTAIICVGHPYEKPEQVKKKALDTIVDLGASDDYKDDLRKTLKVEKVVVFINKTF